MIRRAITTTTEAGLGLARLPLRVAGPMLPEKVRGMAELGADQAQATVESLVGSVFHIDELAERGRTRQVALDQRAQSLKLWTKAGEERRLADLALAEERSKAAERRTSAQEQANEAEAAAEKARAKERQKVEATARKRTEGVREATAKRKAAVADEANERRLEVLKAEEQALDVADDAATAADEAARLAKAASEAKRRRTG